MPPLRSPLDARGTRPAAALSVRRPRAALILALSWAVWVLVVVAFALWTLATYHPPSGPPWVGLSIRAGVFAIWTLIAREWIAIRIEARQQRER